MKHVIISIPVAADDETVGGHHIEITLEDFCKLDISQSTMARLQRQSGSQSSSDDSPNVIFPSQEVMGGGGGHGKRGSGHPGGGRQAHPATQVSVSESGRISTNFAFDNPNYSLSERKAIRDSTLTRQKPLSADSCEGDVMSCIIADISTNTSTTSSFVFGKKITGNDDQSAELFSTDVGVTGINDNMDVTGLNDNVDVTGLNDNVDVTGLNNVDETSLDVTGLTSLEKFPTDDSTLSAAETHHQTYVPDTSTSEANNAAESNEEITVPDSLADTEAFNSTTDQDPDKTVCHTSNFSATEDPDKTVCYTSNSSAKGKGRRRGGGRRIGGGSGVGTKVMITVHSSPGHIARITDAFKGITEKHSLHDVKLQLVSYVSMEDSCIVATKDESKSNTSEEGLEPNSTDRSDSTLTPTDISSDVNIKSDSTASEVAIPTETPTDTTGEPMKPKDKSPKKPKDEADMKTGGDPDTGEPKGDADTGEPTKPKGDPSKSPKKPKDEADMKTGGDPDTGELKGDADTGEPTKPKGDPPKSPKKPKDETDMKTGGDPDTGEPKGDADTGEPTKPKGDPPKSPKKPNETVRQPPKKPKDEADTGEPTKPTGDPTANEEVLTPDEDEKMSTPDKFFAKLKAAIDKPKKIKEYIDHEMKMEEVLVAQFINKSDVTKGPEIGLFVFHCVFAYSMYVCIYVCKFV